MILPQSDTNSVIAELNMKFRLLNIVLWLYLVMLIVRTCFIILIMIIVPHNLNVAVLITCIYLLDVISYVISDVLFSKMIDNVVNIIARCDIRKMNDEDSVNIDQQKEG